MQHREHDLGRGLAALVHVHGDAAAVVDDRDRVVDVDRDVDLVTEARQRLVDGVVDDFVDEVVQPRLAGRPDVHRGPLPHGLEAFEDLDLVGAVVAAGSRCRWQCTRPTASTGRASGALRISVFSGSDVATRGMSYRSVSVSRA